MGLAVGGAQAFKRNCPVFGRCAPVGPRRRVACAAAEDAASQLLDASFHPITSRLGALGDTLSSTAPLARFQQAVSGWPIAATSQAPALDDFKNQASQLGQQASGFLSSFSEDLPAATAQLSSSSSAAAQQVSGAVADTTSRLTADVLPRISTQLDYATQSLKASLVGSLVGTPLEPVVSHPEFAVGIGVASLALAWSATALVYAASRQRAPSTTALQEKSTSERRAVTTHNVAGDTRARPTSSTAESASPVSNNAPPAPPSTRPPPAAEDAKAPAAAAHDAAEAAEPASRPKPTTSAPTAASTAPAAQESTVASAVTATDAAAAPSDDDVRSSAISSAAQRAGVQQASAESRERERERQRSPAADALSAPAVAAPAATPQPVGGVDDAAMEAAAAGLGGSASAGVAATGSPRGAGDAAQTAEHAPPSTGAGSERVELRYVSGWQMATIHHCVSGQEWDTWPMQRDGDTLRFHARVPKAADGPLLEFVITDGHGDWDKAPSGENYHISEPGTFELRDGHLTKL